MRNNRAARPTSSSQYKWSPGSTIEFVGPDVTAAQALSSCGNDSAPRSFTPAGGPEGDAVAGMAEADAELRLCRAESDANLTPGWG